MTSSEKLMLSLRLYLLRNRIDIHGLFAKLEEVKSRLEEAKSEQKKFIDVLASVINREKEYVSEH